eukprot:gb/GEZN01002595.1/.p1 GENE.gb/GEZN01002595.1/~~gb/GEZN01002595.1/.p1  ORF type:complete len:731 (+),score=217.28 gb/GEZN01002595.1/:37-2193(+)
MAKKYTLELVKVKAKHPVTSEPVFELDPKQKHTFSIGRDRGEVDIGIGNELDIIVSRVHAFLKWDPTTSSWAISDNKSINGVYVGKVKLPKETFTTLAPGHVITIGHARSPYRYVFNVTNSRRSRSSSCEPVAKRARTASATEVKEITGTQEEEEMRKQLAMQLAMQEELLLREKRLQEEQKALEEARLQAEQAREEAEKVREEADQLRQLEEERRRGEAQRLETERKRLEQQLEAREKEAARIFAEEKKQTLKEAEKQRQERERMRLEAERLEAEKKQIEEREREAERAREEVERTRREADKQRQAEEERLRAEAKRLEAEQTRMEEEKKRMDEREQEAEQKRMKEEKKRMEEEKARREEMEKEKEQARLEKEARVAEEERLRVESHRLEHQQQKIQEEQRKMEELEKKAARLSEEQEAARKERELARKEAEKEEERLKMVAQQIEAEKKKVEDEKKKVEENKREAERIALALKEKEEASQQHLLALQKAQQQGREEQAQRLGEDLKCGLCLDWFVEAYTLHCCSQACCLECLFGCFADHDECPLCRGAITSDPVLSRIVNNLVLNTPKEAEDEASFQKRLETFQGFRQKDRQRARVLSATIQEAKRNPNTQFPNIGEPWNEKLKQTTAAGLGFYNKGVSNVETRLLYASTVGLDKDFISSAPSHALQNAAENLRLRVDPFTDLAKNAEGLRCKLRLFLLYNCQKYVFKANHLVNGR